MRRFTVRFSILGIFLILASCVTQKSKKEDLGPVAKVYHNTTARYNGYFNADLLIEGSILSLSEQYKDNYNKILPIYDYVEAENPQAEAENLDEAIKKISVVVNLHPVSNWTDDCYLIMGKAQFLKKDYEGAEETLEYMADEFNPKALEKRKSQASKKKGTSSSAKSSSASKAKSKKQRQKEAKKKKKAKDKERKQRKKEIERERKKKKKGKSSSSSRSKTTPKKEEVAKNDLKKKETLNPEDEPAPTRISLGSLEPESAEMKPENYAFKHRPAYQEGLLWLSRTYIERENYSLAERFMDQLEKSPATFKDIRAELAAVQAHYYIKQKQYDRAIEPLNKAVELGKDNNKQARYAFILGQIHQKEGRDEQAYNAFERVVKFGPIYEMEFSARLQMAQNSWLSGKGTAEQAKKNLEKMLKDFKNIDYQDQIYFALAKIALKQDNKPEAIKNLRLSVWNNVSNPAQKAESYLLLADLFFESEDFLNAKYYYDSTLMTLNDKDERFDRVTRLKNNLTGIAKNIEIINLQDSLLRVSRMTDEEKQELAFEINKKRAEEERRKALEKAAKSNNSNRGLQSKASSVSGGGGRNPSAGNSTNPASSFFAYDERAVKRGVREFQRVWSTRTLEDNWRRSNQQSSISEIEEAEEVTASDVLTDEEIEKILENIPNTEQEIAAAHRAIEAALFELGGLYRDRLQHNQKATETLEKLIEQYPETQYQLDALYFLYLAYTDLGNSSKADFYKNKIISEYPNSTYAKVLLDPSYVDQLLDEEQKLNLYYDETYSTFQKGQYKMTSERIAQVGQKFGGNNELQARFALLNAMCRGNLEGKEAYIEALKDVVGRYPSTPEQIRAKEILRLLGEKTASGPGQQRTNLEDSPFTVEHDKLHYMIVVFDGEVDLNNAKIAISDYNRSFHKLDKLKISNIYLGGADSKTPLIVIRRFKDKEKAMEYYDSVQKNKKDFLEDSNYNLYPVTQNNYRQILKTKTLEGYADFFEVNYFN